MVEYNARLADYDDVQGDNGKMIKELTIRGFKSFGPDSGPIVLQPLSFVVGANASGKTNLALALRFFHTAMMQDVDLALNELGGLAETRNRLLRQRKAPKPLSLSLTFEPFIEGVRFQEKPDKSEPLIRMPRASYELDVDVRRRDEVPVVQDERFEADVEKGKRLAKFRLTRNEDLAIIEDPLGNKTDEPTQFRVPSQEKSRLAVGVGFFSLPCVLFRSYVEGWSFFNISPRIARLPARDTADVHLGPAGENLAVLLHKIRRDNGSGTWEAIMSGLRGTVAGFRDVEPLQLPIENKWAYRIIEDRVKGGFSPDSASDGTIRLLTLLVIAKWCSKQSRLIVIEEPENGLHPHLAEHLVTTLREASADCQILVTTHNPDFLDFLEPCEVLICDKIDGLTTIHSAADRPEINEFQRRFRLGELWEQGALGGIP